MGIVVNEETSLESVTSRRRVVPRGALGWIVIGFAALQLLFIQGAIRIDEPNILEIARQIATEPLDPYGFEINWLGSPQPAWEVLANPPLVPAWLAVAGSLSRWSEPWLRLSMLPFACLALFSIAGIAYKFEMSPWAAAAFLACTPAFFLCAHLLMPDSAMLALFLAAVWGAVRAEEGSRAGFALGAVAAFLTPLAKYNGLALVPVLAWYAFTAAPRTRLRLWVLAMMPAAGLAAWSVFGWLTYGVPHVLGVTSHSGGVIPTTAAFAAITYLGTVLVPWVCLTVRLPLVPLKWDIAITALLILSFLSKAYSMWYPVVPSVLFSVGAALGLRLLAGLLARTAAAPRNRLNVMLLLWMIGPIFLTFRLDFSATRYLLAVIPAAILLLAPAVLARRSSWTGPLLGVNLLLCVGIAIGDMRIAELSRSFVRDRIPEIQRIAGGKIFYDGHWGFQHYATELGVTLIDKLKPPVMEAGDVWIVIRNASPSFKTISGDTAPLLLDTERLSPGWPVRTLDYACRANFYATGIPVSPREAYLPFGFSSGASERFDVYRATARTTVSGVEP